MKTIELVGRGKGLFLICDDSDFKMFSQNNWNLSSHGYAMRCEYVKGSGRKNQKNKYFYAHRLLIKIPKGMQVDHINGNRLDCRRENLRIVTSQQNKWNMKKTRGTSRYKGVSWFKRDNKWKAQIKFNSHQNYIGLFISEKQAAKAYDLKAKQLFGEYARPNFA